MKRCERNQSTCQDDLPSKKQRIISPRSRSLGLTEFISHGFSPIIGQLKSRMEDFLVTEIDHDGKLRKLNSFDIPERQKVERNEGVGLVDLSEDVMAGLAAVVSGSVTTFDVSAPSDKGERTALHKSISAFNSTLSTTTLKEGEDSVIRVSLKKKGSYGNRDRERNKNEQYLHFTLLKWNITTADAVLRMSKILQVKPTNFSYSGQKDKRGITSQRMCCRFGEPKRFAGINRAFFEANHDKSEALVYKNNFLMGDFVFDKDELKLGELSGNFFTIVLRDSHPTTKKNLDQMKGLLEQNGFINYFGLQRFGNDGNTHIIGHSILNNDYRGAVMSILTPNTNHKTEVVQALNHYKDFGDAEAALSLLKFKNSVEGILLKALITQPTDFKRALKSLHYKQQTLYTHAYQSYVWNRLVSKRIQCNGTQVLEGDLVYDGECQETSVRKLTAQDIPKTDFSSILLPLPGYDIDLPNNPCGQYLLDILAEDAMTLENFQGPTGKEFNVSGCYRNIIFKPRAFSAEVIMYSDENEKLVFTDVDALANKEFKRKNVGDKTAICLKFQLARSCYATMLLREISRGESE